MVPYFVMVGLPALMALIFNRFKYNSPKENRMVIDAFFFIWLVLLILRSETVGCDLPVYKTHFYSYSEMSLWDVVVRGFHGEFELGFALIAKLLSIISTDFHLVIAVCALISVIPIWKMYRNEGRHGFLIIALFINIAPFVMYFSGLRQVIAMAFIVPIYHYCKQKKVLKCVLLILLAYLFHKSAVMMLLFYPVYHLRLKKQIHILYILPLALGVYVFNVPIFRFLLFFMEGKYVDRYGEGIGATGAYAVLLLLAVILVYTYLIPETEKLNDDTVGLRNILILCVFLQTFAGVHTVAMRMNYYFLLFVPLLIPRIVEAGKTKYAPLIKFSVICMVAFFTFYYFYYAYTDADILNVYPYDSLIKDYRLGY